MSHRTVREPTDEERAELKRMKRQEVGRVAMRAHLILLSSRGHSAPEIADLHDVTHPMVYKWMDRFDEEGLSGLYDREREGRPLKIDKEAEEELRRVLENGSPTEEGYDMTRWTVPTLTTHLENKLGVDVHPETVRDALHRLEYSWKRPRRSLPEDPHYEERMVEIERAIAEADSQTSIVFEDETELRRFPPLRSAWMPVGEQRSVEVPKQNGKFTLYGALDIQTGETITESYEKGRSDYTKSFLEELLGQISGEILLVWDRASWHTSNKVEEWMGEHERLSVFLLPKRAPEDNPVEDLWRALKDGIAANLERGLDVLKAACRRFFDDLSPRQALRTAGISHG